LTCLADQRVRRTSSRICSGQPSRVFSPVSSAMPYSAWRVPSWCSDAAQVLSGSCAIAVSSASVIFQPTE
jgi:hypothetical protein